MTVVIVDYGSGNLRSIAKSCERAAQQAGNAHILVSNDPDMVAKAERIILPGVGAFGDCAAGIRAIPGMESTLREQVLDKGKPFLGVCVGMQLMADKGFEHGEHQGLGWIEGDVTQIQPKDSSYKIPHMGWNDLRLKHSEHPTLRNIETGSNVYFVHSFHFTCKNPDDILVEVEYGMPIVAAIAKDNMVGTQFHPEKSQETGIRFLTNFIAWRP